MTDTPAEPRLREALRAVFADYDEPPTEKYLDEAVHKFRAALAAAPQPALDVERCSGIVCIHGRCKRHAFEGELYCGQHGGPPEYVSDPGYERLGGEGT